MTGIQFNQTAHLGVIILLAGGIVMFIGAGSYFSTKIDLWSARATNTMADYIAATDQRRQTLDNFRRKGITHLVTLA